MNKIFIVILGIVILTAPRAWAQETDAVANKAQVNTAEQADIAVPPENTDNQNIVNDEGYGTDDEEYYGSEEDAVNAEANAQANADANTAMPEAVNAEGPAPDNAVGK